MNLISSTTPAYADWLSDFCINHENLYVRNSWPVIDYCFQLDRQLPDTYGWQFSSATVLEKQLSLAASPAAFNRIYWTSQARNVEAYSTTSFWRGIELLKSAIRSLNMHEVISPAVLSRSLLELSCVFLHNAHTLKRAFSEITFPPNKFVVSKEIEEQIVKMLWGTRYGDPDPQVKQTNILSFIQKVAKDPNMKDLTDVYDFLCDIAHPSFIGNTRFWATLEQANDDGSERTVIGRYSAGPSANKILEKIIWSLERSAAILRMSFENTAEGLKHLQEKTK